MGKIAVPTTGGETLRLPDHKCHNVSVSMRVIGFSRDQGL